MVKGEQVLLRQWLVASYGELKRRLVRRLGSDDAAVEVLHETWLRLGKVAELGVIENPHSYLYRMALNVAVDQHRANVRWANSAQIEAFLSDDSNLLSPERIAEAKSEISALERAIAELPPRNRAVFLAALYEEMSHRDIAARFGISLRSVEREMQRAFEHCARRLEKYKEGRRVPTSGSVLRMGNTQGQVGDLDNDD
jgi:RNA polymerase sigma-70 factor (ECF subfamily)